MSDTPGDDRWAAGEAYEAFMGRWSRRMAEQFVRWLGAEPGLTWLDVGCGTGALASSICDLASPSAVVACDPSEAFLEQARSRLEARGVSVIAGGAGSLPRHPGGYDRVVSGLVLNFLSDPREAVREMRAGARAGGVVAAYVWDYAGRMEFLRVFWDEAVALQAQAREHHEGLRFPICRAEALESVFRDAELEDVRSAALETPTRFASFADYWGPFLGATGPAPAYVASLSPEDRRALRDRLERTLPAGADGAIDLVARAWAARGRVAG